MHDPTESMRLTVSQLALDHLDDTEALADLVDRAELSIDTHSEKGGLKMHIDPVMKVTGLTAADRATLAKLGINGVGDKFTFYIKDIELMLPKVAGDLMRNRRQVHLMIRAIDIKNQLRTGVGDTDLLFRELFDIKKQLDELNAEGA